MPLLKITNYTKRGMPRSRIFYSEKSNIGINPKGFGTGVNIQTFKYEYKHPVISPSLFTARDGKKYIMPGWIEVLKETTLNDVKWVRPKKPKSEKIVWGYKSSSSDVVYKTEYLNGEFRCSCPGFFRVRDKKKGCKHIQESRKKLENE